MRGAGFGVSQILGGVFGSLYTQNENNGGRIFWPRQLLKLPNNNYQLSCWVQLRYMMP